MCNNRFAPFLAFRVATDLAFRRERMGTQFMDGGMIVASDLIR
jgi:hypothetical protein